MPPLPAKIRQAPVHPHAGQVKNKPAQISNELCAGISVIEQWCGGRSERPPCVKGAPPQAVGDCALSMLRPSGTSHYTDAAGRKLSANLTEELLYDGIDIFTNATIISVDLIVGDTHDRQAISFQKCGNSLCREVYRFLKYKTNWAIALPAQRAIVKQESPN